MEVFLDQEFSGERPIPKGEFENCSFTALELANTYLDNQAFLESRFERCNLAHANLSHSRFQEVTLEDCKLTGVDFSTLDTFLLEIRFVNCNVQACRFSSMDLQKCSFSGCQLTGALFEHCDLRSVAFDACDLDQCIFEHCQLQEADFTSALNLGFNPETNRMKGARIQRDSLAGLLKKYDLVIV